MAFSIPSGLFDIYNEVCDELIDNNFIGKECTIIYPPRRIACGNCLSPVGGGTNSGLRGPRPNSFAPCPTCGGSGYKEQEVTDTIRLRIYWRNRDWLKVANTVNVENADVQVIGYASDLTKIKRADVVRLINNQTHARWDTEVVSEPFLHGFGKNRYFVAYLRRL